MILAADPVILTTTVNDIDGPRPSAPRMAPIGWAPMNTARDVLDAGDLRVPAKRERSRWCDVC